MKSEQEFLHVILQDAGIGWWKADIMRRELRMSDLLRQKFGFETDVVSFAALRAVVPEPYLERVFLEIANPAGHYSGELALPLSGPQGVEWVSWKALCRQTEADGSQVVLGYIREVEQSDGEMTPGSRTERINNLLYRLNNISYLLLSLLHTDRIDDSVNKILSDILQMFRGSRTYIIEFDWERRMHLCSYEVTEDSVRAECEYVSTLLMDDTPWWTEQISQNRPIVLSDIDDLPAEAAREREILAAQDIRSLIVMPLMAREKVRGYVGIDLVHHSHNWTNEDCQWFSSLVNIIGLCLELQRSEGEARDERNYLEGLYRHMPLGYLCLKILYNEHGEACDYRVLDSNAAAEEIVGLTRGSYVGRTARELGTPGYRGMLGTLVKLLRTGKHAEYDAVVNESGRTVHAVLYSTRKDEVICLISDTTEIHAAHESLDRSEKLLRNIFDNVQVGMELYDKNGRLLDLNNKDMEIFGVIDKQDVLGINFYDNPNVPPEIHEGVRQGQDLAFRLNYPFDKLGNYYASGKTGYLEIFSTVNMLYDKRGELVNFMLINIDNTEITRAHSRLAEFESSFSLVSRFGKVGYCRFDVLSKEGAGVPQWFINLGEEPDTPLSEVIGVYKHVAVADREAIFNAISLVKADELDSFSLDLRINPGENETWTRVNVMRNPMNNDPEKIEMVCVNYDITELKLTERNLIEAKNKAEVSDRLKSAFLANMSHEIRTPLNAIVGFSSLLNSTDDPVEKNEYMRIVEENNELLLKLISDILDLSKIEAGTFDFSYGDVDVNLMCEEAVRALSLKLENRPVELRIGERLEKCHIVGDKNRLMQIVTNFINNAVKFTSVGSITLGYRVEGDMIRFSVEDTGKGIAADQLGSVFARFVKLNSFAQGTGLGLSICKSIVEQMKGHIGVESEEGRGSRFWFEVPVGGREELRAAADSVIQKTVLVVEDVDSNFLLVSLMLQKEYDIIRAQDGEEAVRLCRECRPDAVLMDIKLPGIDGLEAARQIHHFSPRVPIIAVTAFVHDSDEQRALDAGCCEYMSKPLSGQKLRQSLRRVLAEK